MLLSYVGQVTAHSALTELDWPSAGHTIPDDTQFYFGDSTSGNYFIYSSTAGRLEWYDNFTLREDF